LVILDACRDNPFAVKMARSKLTRSVERGFARVEPTTNVLVAYAAKDGTTAKDGDRRNSPYTAALLRNLEIPGVEISYVFRNVRDEVMASTKRAQQPFVYGSLSSKAIYLNQAPSSPPAPPAAPQALAKPAEESIWLTIKDSTDPQLLQSFLSKFPGNAHEAEARLRFEGLQIAKDCDRLAGTNIERDRARSVAVTQRDDAKPDAATRACEEAMRRFPEVARFAFQAGRAAEARKAYSAAREFYEKASTIGSPLAMVRLGLLYGEGSAFPADYAQARQWYEKAAAQNMPSAMLRLGILYETGRGVERDYGEAHRWYEKAANLGDWSAMMSIGKLYERGLGVPKSAAEARAWYRKAESTKAADKTTPGTAH
jgi:tetratricopeptide (TPR) repeat protein